jgi:hypothetical protein
VTTITEAPADLSWVTFSTEDERDCEAMTVECPNEAVAVAFFDAPCECMRNPQRLCVTHRDRTIAKSCQWNGIFRCAACLARIRLLWIEPLR